MTTDFRQMKQYAAALRLTYQQLLAQYHTACGADAPRSGALAWAQLEMERAKDPGQAQRELRAGFADSRLQRPSWTPFTFRLVPEVQASLAARADTDRDTLPRISPGHYLDAALRTSPRRLRGQLACMRDFHETRGGSTTCDRPVIYLVGADARQALLALRAALAAARLPRENEPAVVSALTARFLSRLAPQRPR